ncbi:MAG: Lon protease family protein [Thiotrichales bacterium]
MIKPVDAGAEMTHAIRLRPEELRNRCDLSGFEFDDTSTLEPITTALGQERAVEALRFGVRMRHDGYNLYLLGSEGLGKLQLARDLLAHEARAQTAPDDFCYVNNFVDPQKPQILRLPAGRARALRLQMRQLVEDLLMALPAAFQTDEHRARMQELEEEFKERQEKAFNDLGDRARARDIAIMSTPAGYTLAPLANGELISPDRFEQLPEADRARIEATIEEIRKDLREVVRQIPVWQREHRQRARALNEEVSTLTVGQLFNGLAKDYAELPAVRAYLETVRRNVIENVEAFLQSEEGQDSRNVKQRAEDLTDYSVNLLVDNAETHGAPVVYEDNPTYLDLIGRIEHVAQMGTLSTDFTLIKAGALLRANGGYLLLDARKVLLNPFAYDGLKRALASRELRIQTLEQMLSLVSTLSLEPEPIPLDLKVVLVGERLLYYLLKAYDPEFGLMFKVAADFAEELPRDLANTLLYARLIAAIQQREALRPLNRAAVGRVLEASSRRVEDREKLSLDTESLGDWLREADFCAAQAGEPIIRPQDVDEAVRRQEYRQAQLRERVHEMLRRKIQLVDTTGSRVGQVNGLSVMQLGDYAFGRPSRITATVRLGSGKVIDIEREVELGGSLHSKGVMILSACLADRYARERPLPISASLVFEQSYGMVEGDSASTAELCALLSALGRMPLRQGLAVTGSINQHGEIQAIGGVNEKIEGFFELCAARGFDGEQGVIIPRANRAHLMLRAEVIDAVDAGRFSIYIASDIDDVMALLTGLPAGATDAEGQYSEGSFNRVLQDRVEQLWRQHQRFQGDKGNADATGSDA